MRKNNISYARKSSVSSLKTSFNNIVNNGISGVIGTTNPTWLEDSIENNVKSYDVGLAINNDFVFQNKDLIETSFIISPTESLVTDLYSIMVTSHDNNGNNSSLAVLDNLYGKRMITLRMTNVSNHIAISLFTNKGEAVFISSSSPANQYPLRPITFTVVCNGNRVINFKIYDLISVLLKNTNNLQTI